MIGELRDYYRRQTDGTTAALLAAVLGYDTRRFEGDQAELYRIWGGRGGPHDGYPLRTSGTTTGEPRSYRFGPDARWIHRIEHHLRFPHGKCPVILISNWFPRRTGFTRSFREASAAERAYTHYVDVRRLDEPAAAFIRMVASGVLAEHDRVILWAQPREFLALTGFALVRDFLAENRGRVALNSTDWEPLYRKAEIIRSGVHVNDHMVNWQTGVNFFRCRFNGTHFLPIFAARGGHVACLLNLAQPEACPNDDRFVLGGHRACGCGRTHHEIDFVPHLPTSIRAGGIPWYRPQIAESLTAAYENLQFIQDGESVDILFTADSRRDIPMLVAEVEGLGLHARPRRNEMFSVNDKKYGFYRNGLGIGYQSCGRTML